LVLTLVLTSSLRLVCSLTSASQRRSANNETGDPYFYFHHAQIDRVWWSWQNLNPANRTNAIYGTIALGDPTAPATKLTDTMTLGHAYPGNITVGDAMSTMGGPFCYTYI
jgi:tyrosinase